MAALVLPLQTEATTDQKGGKNNNNKNNKKQQHQPLVQTDAILRMTEDHKLFKQFGFTH